MLLLVTLLLLLAVILFVGYPLLRPTASRPPAVVPEEGLREDLLAARERVLSALKDLEFEHRIGNVSESDYEALRTAQRLRAVAILSELERLADRGLGPQELA